MMIKTTLYIFGLSLLFFLPDRFWEKLMFFGQKLFDKSEKSRRSLQSLRHSLPVIGDLARGDELLLLFPRIEAQIGLGLKTIKFELPQFKFYTALMLQLLEAHRQLGVSVKNLFPELRANLIKEMQFEKKIYSLSMAGNLQFVIVTLTTWSFILLSQQLADIPANPFILMLIAFLQSLAFIFFNLGFIRIKNRGLAYYSRALEELYFFKGMLELGLPVNRVLNDSNCLNGALATTKQFKNLFQRLSELVSRWKETGLSPRAEVQEIIVEIWHEKEQGYQRFIKHLEVLKFVVLAFFFLPAYFAHLFSIFQFFMEQ